MTPLMTHLSKNATVIFQELLQQIPFSVQTPKVSNIQGYLSLMSGLSHQLEHLISSTRVNYKVVLLCDLCQPQAKGGHLFIQVSPHLMQLFHICSHKPKQTL